ncbi:Uncharacterised protein [Vibrio cholerae]|nr:Uncharacterised protein [Vibrio cholerae]CSI13740.1 Uncharacterised protein [Vibrio cholerae]
MKTVVLSRVVPSKKCRVWGLKRLNSVPASYALWMAKTRSTLQRCTQKRIRW